MYEQCTDMFVPANVYTMYIPCTYTFIVFQKCMNMSVHAYSFPEMYVHVCTMHIIRTYYSIVHTYYIHRTDTSVHVYARCIGFQMQLMIS
jgi:hypothetical protein